MSYITLQQRDLVLWEIWWLIFYISQEYIVFASWNVWNQKWSSNCFWNVLSVNLTLKHSRILNSGGKMILEYSQFIKPQIANFLEQLQKIDCLCFIIIVLDFFPRQYKCTKVPYFYIYFSVFVETLNNFISFMHSAYVGVN